MKLRKIVSIMTAAMLMMPGAALCEESTTDDGVEVVESVMLDGESAVDVPVENAPTLTDIAAANSGSKLLESHYSVADYVMTYSYSDGQTLSSETMSALVATDGTPAYYETTDALSVVYDGQNRYMMYEGGQNGVNVCLDDSIKSYYDLEISGYSLYAYVDGETVTKCTQNGTNYTLTLQISHGAYCDATGMSYGLDDDVPVVTTLTLDTQTLEISEWSVKAQPADGIEITLKEGSVVYDSTTLPEEYYKMAQPDATRTLTIVTNPTTDTTTQTITIAQGALPYLIAPDGYTVAVMNSDGQYVDPDYDAMSLTDDVTMYLISET